MAEGFRGSGFRASGVLGFRSFGVKGFRASLGFSR